LSRDFDDSEHVGEDVSARPEHDRPAILGGALVKRLGDGFGGKETLPEWIEKEAHGAHIPATGQFVESLGPPPRIDRR
jgi:hypothetical protein